MSGMSKGQGCARRFSDSHCDIKVLSLLRKLLIFTRLTYRQSAFQTVKLQQESDKLTGKLRVNGSCGRFAAVAVLRACASEVSLLAHSCQPSAQGAIGAPLSTKIANAKSWADWSNSSLFNC